jgi:hypothetical protein
MKIAFLANGTITADGSPITMEELRADLKSLAERNGVVWYYRESAQSKAPPEALEIVRCIAENRLTVRLSTRPDYSDSVGEDGRSIGKDGKPLPIPNLSKRVQ